MSRGKRVHLEELRRLGCELVPGDISGGSMEELSDVFRRFDTVLGCIGFAAGRGTQFKLAKAALHAEVSRDFPWQFGVDYDVLGRGSTQDPSVRMNSWTASLAACTERGPA